jgi:hypothetical protein
VELERNFYASPFKFDQKNPYPAHYNYLPPKIKEFMMLDRDPPHSKNRQNPQKIFNFLGVRKYYVFSKNL